MKNILIITKKELRAYFNNPTAYIVLVAFLLLWQFLFFRNVFLVEQASLRILFEYLPWIFLVVVPALTMGSVAQEKNDGTIEFILTRPIKELEFLVGKFLGSLAFVAIALLFALPIFWSLHSFGDFDTGVIIGQYLASVLLGAVLVSLGVFVSSLFTSQISALLTAVVASFFLVISGFEIVTSRLPLAAVPFFEQLSVLTHFSSMARGVIDIRDVWYFLSISAVFLSLAYLMLLKNKLGNQKKTYRNFQVGILLFIGIALVTNIIGSRIPGRVDLTEEKSFTLSETTKDIVSELTDVVDITLFVSDKLPAQMQPVLREVDDVLRDYQSLGQGNIIVSRKNPSSDKKIAKEATSVGVQEVRFNVVSDEEFQVKTGYFGVAVSYGGEFESIPFVETTSDLEYQLTSFINKLTTADKKKIVFISGHGEKTPSAGATFLEQELEKQFTVTEVSPIADEEEEEALPSDNSEEEVEQATTLTIPEDTDVIVVAGPKSALGDQAKNEIKKFISNGGSAFFLVDGVDIMIQTMGASPAQGDLAPMLEEEYGIKVASNLVYDLQSSETASFSGGIFPLMISYPFWIRSTNSTEISPVTSRVENVVFPWASSVETTNKDGVEFTELLTTTENSGSQSGQFDIMPDQQFSQSNLKKYTLAISATSEKDQGARMIVVGDSDFITDQPVSNNVQNLVFATEAISWLAQESSLAEIRLKNVTERKLVFKEKGQQNLVKYGNMVFALAAPVLFGSYRMMRRKKMRQRKYEK